MKKITLFAVSVMFMTSMYLVYQTKDALADDDRAVRIPVTSSDEDQGFEVPTPLPGETMTVYVDLPPDDEDPDKLVTYTPTYITYPEKESRYHFRGGAITGMMFPGHQQPSFTGGLVGEISTKKVVVQGNFRAGNCNEGLALDSGLAVMYRFNKRVRAGLGADLLYCSDVMDAPKEKAKERIVGGSYRLEANIGNFVVGGSIGVGGITYQTPGSRQTDPAIYGGFSLGYLWGK